MSDIEKEPLLAPEKQKYDLEAPPPPEYTQDIPARQCWVKKHKKVITLGFLATFAWLYVQLYSLPGGQHPHHDYTSNYAGKAPGPYGCKGKGLKHGGFLQPPAAVPKDEAERIILETPLESRIRESSKEYTAYPHAAGSEGDLRSALYVKNKWEELLGVPITGDDENIFDAGTREAQFALKGPGHPGKHRHHHEHKHEHEYKHDGEHREHPENEGPEDFPFADRMGHGWRKLKPLDVDAEADGKKEWRGRVGLAGAGKMKFGSERVEEGLRRKPWSRVGLAGARPKFGAVEAGKVERVKMWSWISWWRSDTVEEVKIMPFIPTEKPEPSVGLTEEEEEIKRIMHSADKPRTVQSWEGFSWGKSGKEGSHWMTVPSVNAPADAHKHEKREWIDFADKPREPHHHHHHHGPHRFGEKTKLNPFGPRVYIETYYPFLNYPVENGRSFKLYTNDTLSFSASLTEDELDEDPTSKVGRDRFNPYHGLSQSGHVKGQLVYANMGRKQDYELLVANGIDLKGKIVLVRYGGIFRGLKVSLAEELGAAGVVIYTDPAEDGEITTKNGYKPYPDGPARQPSSIQRGSVQGLSHYPGDPLTPYLPAYKNQTRLSRDDKTLNIPHIPSIPLSYKDAVPFLKALNGKGLKIDRWTGGLEEEGVEYFTGPSEEVTVELENTMDDKVTAQWNTMAVIPGLVRNEAIIIGNHRDAWVFGAADPNSGSATTDEIVQAFGELLKKGWRPLRTIIIASWSGEEYGLIGSTEFGEDYREWIKENVAVYLNVDGSSAGSGYGVSASPSLANLLRNVSSLVTAPGEPAEGSKSWTMLDKLVADAKDGIMDASGVQVFQNEADQELAVSPLGSGSDFTVFLQHIGIASANLGFGRTRKDPVYHYHSIYDSFAWMDKYGDPSFERHAAISKVLGLAAFRLATDLILPINVTDYANELVAYTQKVESLAVKSPDTASLPFSLLEQSVSSVQKAAASVQKDIDAVNQYFECAHSPDASWKTCPWFLGWLYLKKARTINKKLKEFENGFIDTKGLIQREWYRNLVVAPGRNLGYGSTTFPGLTESITLDKGAGSEDELLRLSIRLTEVEHKLLA